MFGYGTTCIASSAASCTLITAPWQATSSSTSLWHGGSNELGGAACPQDLRRAPHQEHLGHRTERACSENTRSSSWLWRCTWLGGMGGIITSWCTGQQEFRPILKFGPSLCQFSARWSAFAVGGSMDISLCHGVGPRLFEMCSLHRYNWIAAQA
jgi:hypothetical protein